MLDDAADTLTSAQLKLRTLALTEPLSRQMNWFSTSIQTLQSNISLNTIRSKGKLFIAQNTSPEVRHNAFVMFSNMPMLVDPVPRVEPVPFKPIFLDLACEGLVFDVDALRKLAGIPKEVTPVQEQEKVGGLSGFFSGLLG